MNVTGIRNLQINEAVLKAHVIVPENITNASSGKIDLNVAPVLVKRTRVRVKAWHLDPKAFCTTLHAALKSTVTGYVMQLQQHGKLIETLQWNWAKTPVDGSIGWTPQVVMHVASLSKMITAIAMTKALDTKGISYDASIAPYLPAYWAKGPNIGSVTFRQLMTHTSGFTSGGADFLSVKAQVAAGVPLVKPAQYENSNFSILRVLLPVVHGDVAASTNFPLLNDQLWDSVTISSYQSFVITNIFTPTGSTGTLTHGVGYALAYNSPATGPGWNSGDTSSISGAAGWHFSVANLLKIMGSFRRGNTIFTPAHAQQMLDNMFGIDWKLPRAGDGAFSYSKNGLWHKGAQTEQGVAMYLPEDMELVVFVNSPINATQSFLETVVLNAYNANIK